MSATTAAATARAARPAELPRTRRAPLTAISGGAGQRGRRLDAVRAPLHAKSRVPFLVLCATLMIGSLVAVLVLNTTLARGSYEMSKLQSEVAQTAQDVQGLQEDLSAAETNLDDKARSLGMIPAENPTMVSIETGKVVKGTGQ
jgi:outer membrane murein-binding lipoprotein Lpp